MIIIKYYRTTQILKRKDSDEIVDEVHGYAMAESKEEYIKNIELINNIDPVQISLNLQYDIEHIITECSKEEYDENKNENIDSIIDLSETKSEVN